MGANRKIIGLAFTSRYPRLSNVLINQVEIRPPHDYPEITFDNSTQNALWDTGSQITGINEELAQSLKLVPISKTTIHGVSGASDANVYLVDLMLPQRSIIHNIHVVGLKISKDVGLLIGMDIMGLGDFGISNKDGKTVFSFRIPSLETVNYIGAVDAKKENIVHKDTAKNRRKRKIANKTKKKNRVKKKR